MLPSAMLLQAAQNQHFKQHQPVGCWSCSAPCIVNAGEALKHWAGSQNQNGWRQGLCGVLRHRPAADWCPGDKVVPWGAKAAPGCARGTLLKALQSAEQAIATGLLSEVSACLPVTPGRTVWTWHWALTPSILKSSHSCKGIFVLLCWALALRHIPTSVLILQLMADGCD